MIKSVVVAALLGLLMLLAQPAAGEPYTVESQGVVHDVQLSDNTLIITGQLYEMEPGASVRVAGYASSIAALERGMKVRFVYKVYEGLDAEVRAISRRNVLVEVEQLADSTFIQEF